ncbi:hypothetical protein OJ252_1089 [Cryptosporidium canis]|uniref:Uncharacterized protein n=1 Tax=Cryptosporidium canis TaxID=195482 RepID=A0ABQ8PC02_9CRYT|nr:hypothetical protein OJ252_1089 [Cryptosporidium canis]
MRAKSPPSGPSFRSRSLWITLQDWRKESQRYLHCCRMTSFQQQKSWTLSTSASAPSTKATPPPPPRSSSTPSQTRVQRGARPRSRTGCRTLFQDSAAEPPKDTTRLWSTWPCTRSPRTGWTPRQGIHTPFRPKSPAPPIRASLAPSKESPGHPSSPRPRWSSAEEPGQICTGMTAFRTSGGSGRAESRGICI